MSRPLTPKKPPFNRASRVPLFSYTLLGLLFPRICMWCIDRSSTRKSSRRTTSRRSSGTSSGGGDDSGNDDDSR